MPFLKFLLLGFFSCCIYITGLSQQSDSTSLPLFIPNTFTPNGDGVNDLFYIQGIEDFPDIHISIFDANGYNVYESFGGYMNHPWTGEGSPGGVYYYIIEWNVSYYEKLVGEVLLIRYENELW